MDVLPGGDFYTCLFLLEGQLAAPDIVLMGYDGDWFAGRENVQLQCRANANPPPRYYSWTRLGGEIPEGVVVVNDTLVFGRPLERNDSGVYRCEVGNDIGQRTRDLHIQIQEPPSTTTTLPTTPPHILTAAAPATTPTTKRRALFTSPTLASLPEGNLGTVVGGAVGGALFLLLLLVLGGACYRKQRRTFRGDYYTKQYLGPSDMQKQPQPGGGAVPHHELQEVYRAGEEPGKGSQDLKPKPKPTGEVIISDKDREEWGDTRRSQRDGGYYYANHNHHHSPKPQPQHPPRAPPPTAYNNHVPYLPPEEDCCYDNEPDSDFVSHMDGSVISRREWYV
ncbi:hypothetical protein AGOR_G00027420 [Albula goreensis]|uniref:Ig-like domain-containing protein n=1 Tax=Albula goreensis TaxID=1534307 RepID=A0A8T3E4C3_9TELE|nr:hypothetical protein AGOR_G00027420 [Albula goreensis]